MNTDIIAECMKLSFADTPFPKVALKYNPLNPVGHPIRTCSFPPSTRIRACWDVHRILRRLMLHPTLKYPARPPAERSRTAECPERVRLGCSRSVEPHASFALTSRHSER
jgi:hypothetical protein